MFSASAEGDDAADGIVRRDADGYAVAWHHLDPEAAHAAAELGKHLVALIALHAVQTAAVDRHDGTLHINQIVLAQFLSFPIQILCHMAEWSANNPHSARTASSICFASAA